MKRAVSAAALLLLLPGCLSLGIPSESSGTEEEESVPEADLVAIGTYEVDAERVASDCGEGTIVLAPSWTFETTLSEDEEGEQIFWDTGSGPKPGELRSDKLSFSFDATIVSDLRSPATDDDWLPPCRIRRVDSLDGAFDEDDAERSKWKGSMSFHFEATEGSDCSDMIGQPGFYGQQVILGKLPCDVRYEVNAFGVSDE